jgi:hypothetical protein
MEKKVYYASLSFMLQIDFCNPAAAYFAMIQTPGAICSESAAIESGLIEGTVKDGLYVYRIIPYAIQFPWGCHGTI